MILAIDFDGVIHDKAVPIKGRRMGAPIEGTQAAMMRLSQEHDLVIHTVMATSEGGKRAVEDWLRYYNVPFDEVTAIKPNADVFLDDKAVRFINWGQALSELSIV